ncbi:MAG TPA: transglutaminase-like domain-containing protein, partial [Pirellulales bacterium]|nr:transglutaminase-like domain-containing protein [Pirellulales bacterium]
AKSDAAKSDAAAPTGPLLGKTVVEHVKIGVVITADTGPCRGIVATAPVPMNWPEQQVKVEKEESTPNVQKIQYRVLAGTVRQMIVLVPKLKSGEEAKASVTFEITRRTLLPPTDTSAYKLLPHPEKKSELAHYLLPSPFIESRNEKIVALAKEVTAGKADWAKVEAIYDAGQKRLTYREGGPIKGALEALDEGTGHCEEFSSLFIAMCRAVDIPARTVWVPGHCYSEFYMVDAEGHGYWFPCQSAGDRSFGGIPETRYILQKGDNFCDPDRPGRQLRYVAEFMKGVGGGQPKCQFLRENVKE